MVVLDEHRVGQGLAVVEPASRAHRRLLQPAQPGQRLAGVADPRLARGAHVAASVVAMPEQCWSRFSAVRSPASRERIEPDTVPSTWSSRTASPSPSCQSTVTFRVELGEHLRSCRGAGEHPLSPGHEPPGPGRGLVDDRDRREVAEQAEVFGECPRHDLPEDGHGRIEVAHHALGWRTSTGSAWKVSSSSSWKNRPSNALDRSGWSSRVWVPRDSSRASAADASAHPTANRLRSS